MPAKPNSENEGVVMEACNQKVVAADKRDVDGQSFSNQQRTERGLIPFPFLLNPKPTKKESNQMKEQLVKKARKVNDRGKCGYQRASCGIQFDG